MVRSQNTNVDKALNALKNNRVIALIIVFGLLVISIASFTDALTKLTNFLSGFIGNEIFTLDGRIDVELGSTVPGKITIGIFWVNPQGSPDVAFQAARLAKIDPKLGHLEFKIPFKQPPPNAALMKLSENCRFGIGSIAAFSDENENGIYDEHEEILGFAEKHVITFRQGDFPGNSGLQSDPIIKAKEGYGLARIVIPEEHGKSKIFDDVVPIKNESISITIHLDKNKMRPPNWT